MKYWKSQGMAHSDFYFSAALRNANLLTQIISYLGSLSYHTTGVAVLSSISPDDKTGRKRAFVYCLHLRNLTVKKRNGILTNLNLTMKYRIDLHVWSSEWTGDVVICCNLLHTFLWVC